MQKFSQAPWGQSATMSSDWDFIRWISDANGNNVAKICQPKDMSQEEALANALLIINAPIMFKVLLDVASLLQEHPEFLVGNSKVHYLAHLAAGVAAKATEKSPSVGMPRIDGVTLPRACELIGRLQHQLKNWVEIADDEDLRDEDDYAIKDADFFLQAATGCAAIQAERYWAITGRIPGDDDDKLHIVRASDQASAEAKFADRCWEVEIDAENQRAEVIKKHACENGVYITSVAVSDYPMEEV